MNCYTLAAALFSMSFKDFLRLTPKQFGKMLQIHYDNKIFPLEYQRLNTLRLIQSKGSKLNDPKKLYIFPHEFRLKNSGYSKEQYKKLFSEQAFKERDKLLSKLKVVHVFDGKSRYNMPSKKMNDKFAKHDDLLAKLKPSKN